MAHQEVTVFLNEFDNLKQKVINYLSEKSTDTSSITRALQDLTRFVSENASSIPGYELRKAQNTIMELQTRIQSLEEQSRQGKKFKFVRKAQEPANENPSKPVLEKESPQDFTKKQTAPTLSDVKEETVTLDCDTSSGKDLWLNRLEKTTVIIKGIPSALHLTNLVDCRVMAGPIQTSVFMENCHNSTFALACQQLRLHKSKSCDFYLHISSRVIIEDCNGFRFAPYTR